MLNRLLVLLLLTAFACKKKTSQHQTPKTEPPPTQSVPAKPAKPSKPTSSYTDIERMTIGVEPLQLTPHQITLADGETFNLQAPRQFAIYPAAEGLRRVRFFAKAPDGRLFVTGMHTLADNKRGKVYILDNFDPVTKRFKEVTVWKDKLRNPNSVQFYTDKSGRDWLYLAVTDSLVRYRYTAGEMTPTGRPEKIASFPGDGLNYKYGGWHLTRTLAIHEDKIYVSVGSSCNLCEEKPEEPSRAAIMVMDMDGANASVFVSGVRNAVDIGWVEGKLYGTNMASDHLGWNKPNDHFYQFKKGRHYGWPYCYEHEGTIREEDPKYQSENKVAKKIVKDRWDQKTIDCSDVPNAYTLFEPHGSPLGFEYFSSETLSVTLRNYFLAGLHGPTKPKANLKIGHKIVRFKKGRAPESVIDGFFEEGEQHGRPCDIIQWSEDAFFFSDDHKGVVYYVETKRTR